MSKPLYKVTFLNAGKVYELYARRVSSGALWGFTEERLRDEFGQTRVLHLPMQSIVRIEEVERKGTSAIRDAATGEKVVTPFPLPAKPR
ncbi:DUF1820 family protein [Novilysobacter selenitireducens]|uniref:DUF1820 family protein n=1 Tax=Novilysobacter selenitireducens TaxID=2872639 RepID=A0ABS7T827_9GAMM|nr:DUF1820 family protein [Lysobacter selenitireducens]MBZ4040034.1 DUF1820 family protein [Lysobacter selenitireducens]